MIKAYINSFMVYIFKVEDGSITERAGYIYTRFHVRKEKNQYVLLVSTQDGREYVEVVDDVRMYRDFIDIEKGEL